MSLYIRPKKYLVSCLRLASKSVRWRAFLFLYCQLVKYTWYMNTRLLEPDQISHTQSMVAILREASQIG